MLSHGERGTALPGAGSTSIFCRAGFDVHRLFSPLGTSLVPHLSTTGRILPLFRCLSFSLRVLINVPGFPLSTRLITVWLRQGVGRSDKGVVRPRQRVEHVQQIRGCLAAGSRVLLASHLHSSSRPCPCSPVRARGSQLLSCPSKL